MPIYQLGEHAPKLPAPDRMFIAPDAHIIGRVTLGVDVSVWFGAIIRGDNDTIEIGDGVNIQEHCLLHVDPGFPMRIERNVSLGHHAVVHGCTIGEGSLIGMNAVVLNGAKIGRNCIVGANALVTEGKDFPDNSLIVGSPAKVVRELDEKGLTMLRLSALAYQAKVKTYNASLKRID